MVTRPFHIGNYYTRLFLLLSLVFSYAAPVEGQHYFRNLDWWFGDELLRGKDRLGTDIDRQNQIDILGKYTREMDHEYHLDLSTYSNDFDRSWNPSRPKVQFRHQLRSVDRSHFATRSHLKLDAPMSGKHEAVIELVLQDDHQAERQLAEIGYRYRISESNRIGVSMTVEQFKPDIDWTIQYEFDHFQYGKFDLRLVLLDFANNLIFDTIGVDPVLESYERSYSSKPRLLSGQWSKINKTWKLGLAAGIQSPSDGEIREVASSELIRNRTSDWWFAGIELGYRSPLGDLYIFATSHSDISGFKNRERNVIRTVSRNQKNVQTGIKYCLDRDLWSLSADLFIDDYSSEEFVNGSEDQLFIQDETLLQSEFRREFLDGLIVLGVGVGLQWREFESLQSFGLPFRPNSYNSRSTFTFGLHWRPDALIEIGSSIDMDGDQFYTDRGATRFDGAFGRVVYAFK